MDDNPNQKNETKKEMTPIQTYNGYCFVEVPEGASSQVDLMVTELGIGLQFIITKPNAKDPINGKPYWSKKIIDIPKGSYNILGLASSLSDNDWEGVVEKVEGNKNIGFVDYNPKIEKEEDLLKAIVYAFISPTASGLSLLESMNLKPETTLILKKAAEVVKR